MLLVVDTAERGLGGRLASELVPPLVLLVLLLLVVRLLLLPPPVMLVKDVPIWISGWEPVG